MKSGGQTIVVDPVVMAPLPGGVDFISPLIFPDPTMLGDDLFPPATAYDDAYAIEQNPMMTEIIYIPMQIPPPRVFGSVTTTPPSSGGNDIGTATPPPMAPGGGEGGDNDGKPQLKIVRGDWGMFGMAHPSEAKGESRYLLVLPGFTGDALSHVKFIRGAVDRGFGVLAATPRWTDSVKETVENTRNAIVAMGQIVDLQQLQIVRANSFGAYLAAQVLDIATHINTAIFITPCSARQLLGVGATIGRDIIFDYSDIRLRVIDNGLICLLEHDEVVPELDPYFEGVARTTIVQRFEGEHFTAADADACCGGSLDWVQSLKERGTAGR